MRPTLTLKKAKMFLWKSFFKIGDRGVKCRKKKKKIALGTVGTLETKGNF